MRNIKLMGLTTALASATVASNAQIVDFENLLNTGKGGFTHYGDNVDSGGFNFASILHTGDPEAIASWTPDLPEFYTGSTAIFANYYDDGLMMTPSADGVAFSVFSIDMADVFLNGSGNVVTFTGIHTDLGITINVIPLTDGSTLETYALTGMTDLISLEILDGDLALNGVQIDNLVTVPEPATLAVLALGVAALALRRRR